MTGPEFLKRLPEALNGDAVAGIASTIQFNLSSPAYIQIIDGKCTVHEGTTDAPDVSLGMSDEDLVALLTGKIDGVSAYMSGRLQVDGDLMLAKDIPSFFDTAKLC